MKLLVTSLKGGKGSGWYAPPKGTHVGDRDIKSELLAATSTRQVSKLKKEVVQVLDDISDHVARDRNTHPDKYPDYAAYRQAITDMIPTGYPSSEGELNEWVEEAKDILKSKVYRPSSAEEYRVRRISTVVDSTGKRRARKF